MLELLLLSWRDLNDQLGMLSSTSRSSGANSVLEKVNLVAITSFSELSVRTSLLQDCLTRQKERTGVYVVSHSDIVV